MAAAETLNGASEVGAFAVDGEAAAGTVKASACLPTTILTGPAAASSPLAAFSCFTYGLVGFVALDSRLSLILFISLTFFELAIDCSCGTLLNT